MLMQFLRGFGKVLGLDLNADVPTLGMLQEGLLNVGDSMGQVQDLLVKLLSLAVCDPGLPPGQKVNWFMYDFFAESKSRVMVYCVGNNNFKPHFSFPISIRRKPCLVTTLPMSASTEIMYLRYYRCTCQPIVPIQNWPLWLSVWKQRLSKPTHLSRRHQFWAFWLTSLPAASLLSGKESG